MIGYGRESVLHLAYKSREVLVEGSASGTEIWAQPSDLKELILFCKDFSSSSFSVLPAKL